MPHAPTAVVTGASRGLGYAITGALYQRGWRVIVDARDGERLRSGFAHLVDDDRIAIVPGDVTDASHRQAIAQAVAGFGQCDLLVNNASVLSPSPQPALAHYPVAALERVFAVNALAPIALTALLLPALDASHGTIVNVTSDASTVAYPTWGGYGGSKAALDQMTAVLALEHPAVRVFAFDPGDMATQMHQEAFPGEDISDRPSPESVIPAFLQLVESDVPSGRYRAVDLPPVLVR